MIISEKSIIQLISIAHSYRAYLLVQNSRSALTEAGQQHLKEISYLLTYIANTQSNELKAIE